MDLVCVGDVMLDVHVASGALARGGDVHGRVAIRPGGTSANAAVWAVWSGATSAVIASVGDDLVGRLCVQEIAARGVEVDGVVSRPSPTGVMVIMSEVGERSMVADRGANAALEPADVRAIGAAAVLVSGYLFLQEPGHDAAVAALESARTPLLAIEAASWPLIEGFGPDRFFAETGSCDVVFANEKEAVALVGLDGADAARALGERYRIAVVKRGAAGAVMSCDGGSFEAEAEPILERESTGAGDAFDGVFLAWLSRGRPGRLERWDLAGRRGLVTFLVSDEIAMAVDRGFPVVGLETSVIGQGLPYPRNLGCLELMEAAIRAAGALPAWTAVLDGAVRVGLDRAELERIAEPGTATKVARRDLPMAVASGSVGATTVSATIWASHRAGIAVSATGGIGGVHPGARAGASTDVSADLLELARTPILLVCSGPKSIVEPLATAEKLEELGVAVVGFGVDRLPFFLAREAPVALEHRVDTPDAAAELVGVQRHLGATSAVLLCNPIASEHAMDPEELLAATARAQARLEAAGVDGKAVTPYLLAALAQETQGRSLEANLVLLEANARLAAQVAAALSAATSGR